MVEISRAEYAALVRAYGDFLVAHDQQRATRWSLAVESDQPEGLLFEATVWRALTAHGVSVTPLPEATRGVDFACVGPTGTQ